MNENSFKTEGRKRFFTEQEAVEMWLRQREEEISERLHAKKVVQVPTEEQWFEVNPQDIDQKIFQKERRYRSQEETRKLILEAFAEVERFPNKYGKKFKTMRPKKPWQDKTVGELVELANKLGDRNANWVEQALEWAQRIFNGESWADVCNYSDTANWKRLVEWKDGYWKIIGGTVYRLDTKPASYIHSGNCDLNTYTNYVVPLVVKYEK